MCKQFTEAGFMADADLNSGCLLNKKIRNAQLAQFNFVLGEIILLEVLPNYCFAELTEKKAVTLKPDLSGYFHNIHSSNR